VAVKVVSKKSLNKTSMENLLTEIEILKTVRHPHIVQLKDFQVQIPSIQFSVCVIVLVYLSSLSLSVSGTVITSI